MRQMTGLNDLRELGRMTWIEQEHAWVAAPEEIVKALSKDGFEECKREMATSRRDRRPAGGVWQGVDTRTGSVASAIWVNRLAWHQAIVAGSVWQGVNGRTGPVASAIWADRSAWDEAVVFIAIDGESLGDCSVLSLKRDPHREGVDHQEEQLDVEMLVPEAPLKLSMKGLSVGFPGSVKSSRTE